MEDHQADPPSLPACVEAEAAEVMGRVGPKRPARL
jgi:hypothetical protein